MASLAEAPGQDGPRLARGIERQMSRNFPEGRGGGTPRFAESAYSPLRFSRNCRPPFPPLRGAEFPFFEDAARAFAAYRAASGELARRDYLNEALSGLERARQMAAESPDVPQPFAALLLLLRLEELKKVPIVLYGQWRMGKTSILKHVGVIPVLVDLQGLLSDSLRPIRSDRDLWQALMWEIGLIVLMLDEFEKLEQQMSEGAVTTSGT